MFLTVLFVVAFTNFVTAGKHSRVSLWLTVIAAILGVCTRIALLPLLVVPVALVQWRQLFAKPRPRQDMSLFFISLLTTEGVVITFTGLHLWDSLAAARAFAQSEQFIRHFSLETFAKNTFWALQLALPLGIWHAKRVLTDERLTIPLITILGFEGMLLVGRIIPWLRYWAPIAPLASGIASALLFHQHQLSRIWWLAILGLVVAGNLVFVATQVAW
jgi:hypothetical protein